MQFVNPILGAILLLFGRSLYWLFVAIAGFLVGMELADQALAGYSDGVQLLAAIACGVLGAVIGILAQRIAFAIGGLYAGGYLALNLADEADAGGEPWVWFVIGGILGAILAALLMDWAIILLSSLAGAGAIVTSLDFSSGMTALLLIALVIIGMVVQGSRLAPRATVEETPP